VDIFFFGRRQHRTHSFCSYPWHSCFSFNYMTESIQGLQIPCHLVRTSLEKVKKNCTRLREKMNACVRMIKKKKKIVLLVATVLCLVLLCFSTLQLKMLSWFPWSNLRDSLHVNDCGYCNSDKAEVWKVKLLALTMQWVSDETGKSIIRYPCPPSCRVCGEKL